MSAVEVAACVSWTTGMAAGAGLVAVFWWRSRRTQAVRSSSASVLEGDVAVLSAADRQAVATQFAQHVSGVRRQVRAYADELADGDTALRERLRRVEGGLL